MFGGKQISDVRLFEDGTRTSFKQEYHTAETAKLLEQDLKNCLTKLTQHLFGHGMLDFLVFTASVLHFSLMSFSLGRC